MDTEHCSEVMTIEDNSSNDVNVNGVGSWKSKRRVLVSGDDITGSSTLEDKCRENHKTEGRNIEIRTSEGSLTLEIKSERNYSPNVKLIPYQF